MKRKNTKIVLTGCRATGKTSVGRGLAHRLFFSFIDTDQEIERLQGKSISEMVEEHGWSFFRTLEHNYLSSLLKRENMVVAPGGGAIMHHQVWAELMSTSLIVWLQADVHTVSRRLSGDCLSTSQRPALTRYKNMIDEISAVMAEREPLYRQGSHHAVSTDKPVERVVEEILELWAAYQQE